MKKFSVNFFAREEIEKFLFEKKISVIFVKSKTVSEVSMCR